VKAAAERSGRTGVLVSNAATAQMGLLRRADAGADQAEYRLPAEVRGLTGKAFFYPKGKHAQV
jgi:hypothetical protein